MEPTVTAGTIGKGNNQKLQINEESSLANSCKSSSKLVQEKRNLNLSCISNEITKEKFLVKKKTPLYIDMEKAFDKVLYSRPVVLNLGSIWLLMVHIRLLRVHITK